MIRQFVAYGLSGLAAASTHLLVLIGLVELAGTEKALSSTAGFLCALPVNYALQFRFVFGCRSNHVAHFSRYLAVTVATLGLNTALFSALVDLLAVQYVMAQVGVIGAVAIVNFLVNRNFTFARA